MLSLVKGIRCVSVIYLSPYMCLSYMVTASNAPNEGVLAQQQELLVQQLRPECPDPVTAGFLKDQDTLEIFDLYVQRM